VQLDQVRILLGELGEIRPQLECHAEKRPCTVELTRNGVGAGEVVDAVPSRNRADARPE